MREEFLSGYLARPGRAVHDAMQDCLLELTGGMLHHDGAGCLLRSGDTAFYCDKRGALAERYDCRGASDIIQGHHAG